VRLVRSLTLTYQRLRRFSAPYFFDLGPSARVQRSDDEIVDEAAEMMWLTYYPFLDCLTTRRPAGPFAVTNRRLLGAMLATGVNSQAHLLVRLRTVAGTLGGDTARDVRRLEREVHTAFEELVAERLRGAGMTVALSVSDFRSRPLPCGEIDVIAAAHCPDGTTLVLVCEAKNVDLALQKDLAYNYLAETVNGAIDQVSRKARWVCNTWPELASLIGFKDARSYVVMGLIVTRRPVPLSFLGRWPGITLAEVAAVAQGLLSRRPNDWRRDLALGIVCAANPE
jgi:hypothetical protein